MTRSRLETGLAVLVSLLVAIAAGCGVLLRGTGATLTVTSPRGQVYEMATTGVYAWNAQSLVHEGVGWDIFTLLVAAPAMAIAAALMARGTLLPRIVAMGLYATFVYQYLEYATTWAFGPLFLIDVAILAVSVAGIVELVGSVAGDGEHRQAADGFPRWAWAALSLVMASLLAVMWLGRIAAGLAGDLDGAGLFGGTTLVVQALDLGLVVPILVLSAVYAWRGSWAGQVAAAVVAVLFLLMALAIAFMVLFAGIAKGALELPPVVIFTAAALAAALIARRMLQCLKAAVASDGVLPTVRGAASLAISESGA